jgi:hypothetical protein
MLSVELLFDSSTLNTFILELPGQDSNLRPIGYTCPNVSARGGLSHHPLWDVGRYWIYWTGSSSIVSAPFWLPVG